jgi:hypothetical protein
MRRYIAIVIAVALAAITLPAAGPARADHEPAHEPVRRVQLVVSEIRLLIDDTYRPDELLIGWEFTLSRRAAGCPTEGCDVTVSPLAIFPLGAGYGDTLEPNFVLGGDRGMALYGYGSDSALVVMKCSKTNYCGRDASRTTIDHTGNLLGRHHFRVRNLEGRETTEIVYEFRIAPLPDLQIVELYTRTERLVGGQPAELCVRFRNAGGVPTGRFYLHTSLEGAVPIPPALVGGLWVGQQRELCTVETVTAGAHVLEARLEHLGDLPELDQANNRERRSFTWNEPPRPVSSQPATGLSPVLGPAERGLGARLTLPGAARARITTDKAQYHVGEPIRICYTVPGPGPVNLFDATPDGRSHLLVRATDDGTGDCLTRPAVAPAGTVRLKLEVYAADQPTQQVATAEATYTVIEAPTCY